MAYNYLDEKQLADALHDSEEYMVDFYKNIPEIQRITRGKPGKVPKGKPRLTDGTLAGYRREMPKQIIQQLPSGKVTIDSYKALEQTANGVLTDIILPNANTGGTPYSKAKKAVRSTVDVGSAWAVCFFNRTGSIMHADYKLKYFRDVLFEKGKTTEFDSNFFPVVDWYTEADLKALIWQETHLADRAKGRGESYEGRFDPKKLQKLLDNGAQEKDREYQSKQEQDASFVVGYFKIVTFYQIGVGGTFFYYAPQIKQVVGQCLNPDPRGVMPVHGLVAEEDDDNPLGEPLAKISTGKQNLLDFEMQMYQYGQGMAHSPTVKKWGSTPTGLIKITPDNVIPMNGTRATDDFEIVNTSTAATANYANNSSYIKTQIYNELGGSNDTSISSDAGAVGFSKTDAGVKSQVQRTGVSQNDLRKTYEEWQARIWETCLNIHFAESKGTKELQLKETTLKKLNMEAQPSINYDQEFGPIKFHVEASSSQATDSAAENEQLTELLKLKKEMVNPDDKDMKVFNQIVRNAGVENSDDIMYSDEDIQQAQAMHQEQLQMAHASAKLQLQQAMNAMQPKSEGPKPLGEAIAWQPGDLTPNERAQALQQVGIQADQSGAPTPNQLAQATDNALKTDKHATDSTLAQAKLAHEQEKHAIDTGMKLHKQAQDSAIQLDSHVNPPEPVAEPVNG